jgi:hypothetical protein
LSELASRKVPSELGTAATETTTRFEQGTSPFAEAQSR